jgi:hypothetical protein
MVLALNPTSSPQPSAPTATSATQQTRSAGQPAHTITFTLVDASPTAIAVGENLQPGKANYFIGNDPSQWRTNIPTYGRVRYKNVYPGIDLVYYGNQRQVEYDFVVAGGADPNQIKFQISGADQLRIDDAGDLVLKVGSGELKFQAPAIYQESNGQRTPISGRYQVDGNEQIVFEVDKHDGSKPLVIDPVLAYSTYLGGRSADDAYAIGLDSIGNLYLAGNTSSPDFPLAVGTVPSSNTNPMYVAKLDVSGSNLLYATYIAGSVADSPHSMNGDCRRYGLHHGYNRVPKFSHRQPLPGKAVRVCRCVHFRAEPGWSDSAILYLPGRLLRPESGRHRARSE